MNNIITDYWPKPIPDRRFDWDAWLEDADENGYVGHGLTEQEAINDLKDHYETI